MYTTLNVRHRQCAPAPPMCTNAKVHQVNTDLSIMADRQVVVAGYEPETMSVTFTTIAFDDIARGTGARVV